MDKYPVFDSLETITKVPSSPQANKDQPDTFAVQTKEIPMTGAAGSLAEKPSAADVGQYYPMFVDLFFFCCTDFLAFFRYSG